ncbi:MAG: c-type cytochrome domain-containing protein, partial [Planctomycetaceae bacterium]
MNRFPREVVVATLVAWAMPAGALFAQTPPLSFNRDVRPILSENCFACHGPDKGNRKAELRLDLREAATAPAESGDIAIVPGDVQKSVLLERIFESDES